MKRRLNRAYDHMTMPDSCAHRIEQRMTQQLKARQEGTYIKAVVPATVRWKGWAAAVTVVCLILVLSVGGTTLFLGLLPVAVERPTEPVAKETAGETTSEDYCGDTAIRDADPWCYSVRVYEDETRAIDRYTGLEEAVKFPSVAGQYDITQFGTGRPVIENGDVVKMVILPETITDVKDHAFANCEALEDVFFQGDAPAEAEGVFDGSENVTVYYPEGTKGWGETWCGRKTVSYGEGHISLGAASVGRKVPAEFADVLSGEPTKFTGNRGAMTLEEYCAALWGAVTVERFTVADMDADGVCEVVASVLEEGERTCSYLVLRQEGSEICGYSFGPGEMYDLKKDGSFGSARGGPGQGSFRLCFEGNGSCAWSQTEVAENVMEVLWHAYPCQRPELLLQSYEYATGIGRSRLPGGPYYHFEGLVLGSMGNDWALQKEQLLRYGTACVEDEGTVCVFDPDAPGTALYGVLTNENGVVQFSELGYYICTEEKEYVAEVQNMLSEAPEYWVDAHLPAMGSMGRQVFSPEELISYFGFTLYSDAVISERNAAREVLENFTAAWIARDEKAMKQYLADDFREDTRRNGTDDLPAGPVELVAILNLPYWEEECYVTAEFRETEQNSYFSICLDLVKQKDGWKVRSCYYGSP